MTSNVIGNLNTVTSKITWEISKFCLDNKKVWNILQSPQFTAMRSVDNDVQWHLRLYPISRTSNDYLALYLHSNKEVKAKGYLAILNNKGEFAAYHNLKENEFGLNGWGDAKFALRDFLVNPVNDVLNDDKITFVCKIIMPAYEKQEIKLNRKVKNQNADDVLHKYEVLLNDSKFSDVSLISEGKILKAHKCILANSSCVFAAMFDAEMKEKQENTVEIVDIKYDVLVEMVRFIYAGKVDNIDTLAGELAAAADKYALDGLKTVCETSMRDNLSLDNVIECLELADKLRMDGLKEMAIEFTVENGSDVTDKPEFESLPSDVVIQVCRSMGKKSIRD